MIKKRFWMWTLVFVVMHVTLLAVMVLPAGCGVEGFHNANPTTRFVVSRDLGGGKLEFEDNKDNDVSIDKLSFNPKTKQVEVDKLVVKNNASKVRESNSGQIYALAEQQTQILKGVGRIADIAAAAAQNIIPGARRTDEWMQYIVWIAGFAVAIYAINQLAASKKT